MDFKEFLNYAVLGYSIMNTDCQKENSEPNSKKLVDNIWLAYFNYEKDVAKEKASEVLSKLETV